MMISTAMMLLLTQTAATPPAAAAPARQPTRAEFQARAKAGFDAMDANHDGQVDAAEAGKAFAARAAAAQVAARQQRDAQFAKMDNNKDNVISKQEFDASVVVRQPATPTAANWIAATDADKNGKVSLTEAAAQLLANFDRIDANRDGVVSPAEANASRAAPPRR